MDVILGPPQVSVLGKEGMACAALVKMEDIYPEGGSGKIGMEINVNMVETFDGWIGTEHATTDELVAAINDRSKSPQCPRQRIREYRQRS